MLNIYFNITFVTENYTQTRISLSSFKTKSWTSYGSIRADSDSLRGEPKLG